MPIMNTRREWIVRNARWGGLLVLGGIVARLAARGDATCELQHPCGACPQFAGCGLPKAKEARPATTTQPSSPPAS